MVTVTANEQLHALLAGVTEEAEIRDADGNVLGYYTPRARAEARLYEKARALFDSAQTKRRKEAERGKGYTIEQVMERLKALGASECDSR
jgi:hypothetical protein